MRIILLLSSLLLSVCCHAQMDCIRTIISEKIQGKHMKPGIAIYDMQTGDSLMINGWDRFPMQSVYKFPIALAILHKTDKGEIALNDSLLFTKAMLDNKLWSPIREKYPEGNIRIPLSEIIEYTVALSDNNGSDLLMSLSGGPASVDSFIRNMGITDIRIKNYEKEMQADWNIQFQNYATPEAMIRLLIRFNQESILKKETHNFLWDVMGETSTGSFRKYLPENIQAIRKTGNSGFNAEGISAATNDAGIFILEDGRRIAYAIFVNNSSEDNDTNYNVIADIAKAIYDCYH